MDKQDIERRLEAAEKQNLGLMDEIKNLKAKLAEMQDEPEIPDFPEFNNLDVTYQIDSCLDVMQEEHGGGKGDKDFTGDDALFYNNFHTESYAAEFRKKCLLIAMMLHCKWYLCRDFKGDYSNSNDKWVVYYSGLDNKFLATNSIHCDYGFVPFDTKENAQKCAEWLNEHWKEDGNEHGT